MGESIAVLHVDDEPGFADLAATFMERADDRFDVETAESASEALEKLTEDVDCVVSDYDMPGQNGIEFLRRVREDHPDLPFILFTGKGNEEIASDAISAGVSDYLQKDSGTDQYTVLANRISNLVRQARAEARLERHAERELESEAYRRRLLEITSDPDASTEEQTRALLELGCERLGTENGHLVRIDEANERHEVVSVFGSDVVTESVTDLEETYCSRTIESEDVLTLADAPAQLPDDDPAVTRWGLGCYIGKKLLVGEELYGTLCFASEEPREESFTHNEKAFVDLLGRWFNQLLERERREAQAQTVFERTQDGIFVVDVTPTGEFAYRRVNRAYERMTGLSTADVEGKTPVEVFGEDEGQKLDARYRDCVEHATPIEYEVSLSLDGEETLWRTKLAPVLEDGDVVQLVGATRDVTDRKAREREVELLTRAMEEAPIGITITDPDQADNPIVYANDAFLELTGYEEETVLGENCRFLQGPDTDPATVAEMRRAIDEAKPVSVELLNYRQDGSTFWNHVQITPIRDDGGEVTNFVGFQQDVSEDRRHREALTALHDVTEVFMQAPDQQTVATQAVETARTVLDQPINAVWLYDEADDVLRPGAWTDEAAETFSKQPVFRGGESLAWSAFQAGEVHVYDDVHEEPERFNAETPVESEVILPLGQYGVMVLGSLASRRYDEMDLSLARTLANLVAAALARADREAELRARRQDLETQNERLEEFAGIVSHDLRNPLNVATGRLELARQECDSEYLDDTRDALDRMGALIEDILALAREREEPEDLEPIDLAGVVDSCWRNVSAPDASFVNHTSRTILGDRGRLQRLLENLVRNAVEHGSTSPDSDTRQDAVEHSSTSPDSRAPQDAVDHGSDAVKVTVGELEDGFYVEDDGSGIPPEERGSIFESGYSTSTDGTGFGLAIVEEIAEAHGWSVRVTEGSEGGARFEIRGVEFVDDPA